MMVFHRPKVEFIPIDSQVFTSESSSCPSGKPFNTGGVIDCDGNVPDACWNNVSPVLTEG